MNFKRVFLFSSPHSSESALISDVKNNEVSKKKVRKPTLKSTETSLLPGFCSDAEAKAESPKKGRSKKIELKTTEIIESDLKIVSSDEKSDKSNQPPFTGDCMQQASSTQNAVQTEPNTLQGQAQGSSEEFQNQDSYGTDEMLETQGEEEFEYDESEESQDSYDESSEEDSFQLAPNQTLITMTYTLMNQVKQVARQEGVTAEDILIELIAEGLTRRAFQDASRPGPSHLITRTGYVPPQANGMNTPQPVLSHHNTQNRRPPNGNSNPQNNRRFSNADGNYQGNNYGNSNYPSNNRFNPRNNQGNSAPRPQQNQAFRKNPNHQGGFQRDFNRPNANPNANANANGNVQNQPQEFNPSHPRKPNKEQNR